MAVLGCAVPIVVLAQNCPARFPPGSVVPDPPLVSSKNGVLGGTFYAYFDGNPALGRSGRYCLMYSGDPTQPPVEAPVLRVKPGDRVALGFVNRMPATAERDIHDWNPALNPAGSGTSACSAQASMQNFATNLHFHGTNVSPVCASDEVLTTLVKPNDAAWHYNFQLPSNAPPGLDWYHPHVHGIAQEQMVGGMTGALVIDAPNAMPNVVAGLRERILILRDQDTQPPPPGVRYVDRPDVIDGLAVAPTDRDIFDAAGRPASSAMLRTLLAGGTVVTSDPAAPGTAPMPSVVPPWKDLSINKVEINFKPSARGVAGYTTSAVIRMEAANEFWRVANVSADSYLRLQVRFSVGGVPTPQVLRVVSMDGVPISAPNGQLLFDDGGSAPAGTVSSKPNKTLKVQQVLLPPGGRVEFIAPAPPAGQAGELVSMQYETNADSNPLRVLASLAGPAPGTVVDASRVMPMPTASLSRTRFVDLGSSAPKAVPDHTLYFSQNDTEFFITEDASTSKAVPPPIETAFSMRDGPSIYVPNGATQEWRIENRAPEAHAFHLHQIRFRVLKRYPSGDSSTDQIDEFALRDTVDLPAYSGTGRAPFVTLRIYFTEPDIRGNFVYHCHILEHEDKGMMGIVRVVDPAAMPVAARAGSAGPVASALAGFGLAHGVLAKTAALLKSWGASLGRPTATSVASVVPVLRDRYGQEIAQQLCTRPPKKPRRALVALAGE